ncbi:hypothetical protein ACH4F6_31745 [Streptomyces sp. NPDC017936]|uniref:hypothetical protein n=1 Tax=Streptomyces sp. NPDC017936 TaxID=3365016 RepID=UPI003798C2CC
MAPSISSDLDPFWVDQREQFLAKKSTSADPSACGTCRRNAEAGQPVEHDECQQRATILHAPDHPDYELLAGFSLEENAKLPARFHVPVFDDLGVPNAWHCAVCWEDGVVTGWPCATATEQGTKVFSPLHDADTARRKQQAELAELRSENARLRDELTAVRAERDQAQAELADVEAEREKLVRWHDEDGKSLARTLAHVAELKENLRAVNAGWDVARARVAEADRPSLTEFAVRLPSGNVLRVGDPTSRPDQESRLARYVDDFPAARLVQRSVVYGEWTEADR